MDSSKVREYLRRHVLGLMAIFIALSGTAIAAGDNPTASSSAVTSKKFKKLKKRVGALEATLNAPAGGDLQGSYPNLTIRNSAVTSGKIADAAVVSTKIGNNAVNATKIADNSVTTTKIADDAVTTTKILNQAVNNAKLGINSVTTDKILNGQVRAADLSGLNIRTRTESVAAGGSSSVTATNCNAGELAFSGGGQWNVALPTNVGLQTLAPINSASWLVRGRNQTGGALDLITYVVCLAA